MERGIQIKGAEDPDPRAFDTDAVLVGQEEIEEQFAQVPSHLRQSSSNKQTPAQISPPSHTLRLLPGSFVGISYPVLAVRHVCPAWVEVFDLRAGRLRASSAITVACSAYTYGCT